MIGLINGFSFLLPALGIEEEVAQPAGVYLRIGVLFFFFHQIFDSFRKILNCLGFYCVHFPVPLIALGVNVLANYYFVAKMELGVVGAGLA